MGESVKSRMSHIKEDDFKSPQPKPLKFKMPTIHDHEYMIQLNESPWTNTATAEVSIDDLRSRVISGHKL